MTRGPVRRGAALLSAGLVLAVLPMGPAGAAEAAAPAPTRTASATHTVTLVTGDKVTVTDLGAGRKTVAVERPRGPRGRSAPR